MKFNLITLFVLVLFMGVSCGGSKSGESTESTASKAEASEPQSMVAEEETQIPDTAVLEIEGNDQMQFNLDQMEVYEGQVVKLTLIHVGEMSVEAMGHNWVLLKPGTDKAKFANASVSAKDNNYIAPDMEDQVIVATKTIGGGEKTTIVFEAPKTGYYDFICSFPGHYGVMQGTFAVKPK